jgi:hypothetical protein
MQSIFGALLTAGYAAALTAAIAASPDKNEVTAATQSQLTKSFDSASAVAAQYPQYSEAIISAAKTSFLEGDRWAYTAGLVAVLLGAALVYFFYPRKDQEITLLAAYHKADEAPAGTPHAETPHAETPHTDTPHTREPESP